MDKKFRNEQELIEFILSLVNDINNKFKDLGFVDFQIKYIDYERFANLEFQKIDENLRILNGYDTFATVGFHNDGYGYNVIEYIKRLSKHLDNNEFKYLKNANNEDFERKLKFFVNMY